MTDQLGWHKVPAHDPEIQDAANYALRTIQQRSNCHSPYQLLEILQAEAEVKITDISVQLFVIFCLIGGMPHFCSFLDW